MIKIKQIINNIVYSLSKKLIFITIKYELFFLCYLILFANIRRIKKIKKPQEKKTNYKALVLSKSGGLDDLINSQEIYNKKILYYIIPRGLIRKIYNFYLDEKLYDYRYLTKDKRINKQKILYRDFLFKLLKVFQKFFNLDAIITFNLFYKADREIQFVTSKLGIKFIVLQKECVHSPVEEKIIEHIYKHHSGKYYGTKVGVYSKAEKQRMVKSKIIDKKDIEITGCSRLDLCFKYKNIVPIKNQFLYYMIENDRGTPYWLNKVYNKNYLNKFYYNKKNKEVSWSFLNDAVIKNLISFAKNNPKVNIIFKGKTGVHSRSQLPKILPNNCKYIDGGSGHKLLIKSSLIICFNSTVIMEAIAAQRNIVIPFYKIKNKFQKQFLLKFNLKKYLAKNENIFFKKLNEHRSKKYKSSRMPNDEKFVLNYYLGNIDGTAGKRLNNFLESNICRTK